MKTSWQELIKHLGGHITGGEAVVRINRKHVSLGRLKNGVFAWTPAGMELSETFIPPVPKPASSAPAESVAAPTKRKRRTRAQMIADRAAEMAAQAAAQNAELQSNAGTQDSEL